jgi:hypothetical protein
LVWRPRKASRIIHPKSVFGHLTIGGVRFNKADVRTDNESVTEGKNEDKLLSTNPVDRSFSRLCWRTNYGDDHNHTRSNDHRPAREVVVTRQPPPVRIETQTVAPGPGYVWTSGYWRWTRTTYVWVPGSWIVRPRPAAVWVAGHWVPRYSGWVWVAGHWQ